METDYTFGNFMTPAQAFQTMREVEQIMPELIRDRSIWNSYHIVHDAPEVWRLWTQLGKIRAMHHFIFTCDKPFFHFHPSRSVVKCHTGGYEHTIAMYNGPLEDILKLNHDELDHFSDKLTKQTGIVVPGYMYEMTDMRHMHGVKAFKRSTSTMITDEPYFPGATKFFSRETPALLELDGDKKNEMFDFFEKIYPISE